MSSRFCPDCDVVEELHDRDLDDPCEDAERQAAAIERMERLMFGFVR